MVSHEQYSNAFLRYLDGCSQFASSIEALTQPNVYLLLPKGRAIQDFQFDKEFFEAHLIYVDPACPTHFVTSNGMLGLFSGGLGSATPDALLVISLPSNLRKPPSSLFNAPLFAVEKDIHVQQDSRANRILDRGTLPIQGKECHILLVSDPIVYVGCSWEEQPRTRRRNSSFLSSSDSPKAETESEAPVVLDTPGPTPSRVPASLSRTQSMSMASLHPASEQKKKPASKNPFLQRVNHPSAAPIASSIQQFVRMTMAQPQSALVQQDSQMVREFLDATEQTINTHPLWQNLSEKEMEENGEALEKFLTVNLHAKLFGNRAEESEKDMLINETLNQLEWVTFEHLEIDPRVDQEKKSMELAVSELKKVNKYKAPKDKLVCIRNCSKVVYKMLESAAGHGVTAGADDFLPLLIIVLIRANPANLMSNIQYIRRFRNPSKLLEEAGYYLTQLESAVHFLLNIKPQYLKNVTEEEFHSYMNGKVPGPRVPAESSTAPVNTSQRQESDRGLDPLDRVYETLLSDESLIKYTFIKKDFDDLTMADVRQLFCDYKKLARQNEVLRRVALTPTFQARVPTSTSTAVTLDRLELVQSDNQLSFPNDIDQEQPEELLESFTQEARRRRSLTTNKRGE